MVSLMVKLLNVKSFNLFFLLDVYSVQFLMEQGNKRTLFLLYLNKRNQPIKIKTIKNVMLFYAQLL